MPIRVRHIVRNYGAVSSGAATAIQTFQETSKGLFFVAGDLSNVHFQATPDGGSNTFLLKVWPTNESIRVTPGARPEVVQIPWLPGSFRMEVFTDDADNLAVEGVREIG